MSHTWNNSLISYFPYYPGCALQFRSNGDDFYHILKALDQLLQMVFRRLKESSCIQRAALQRVQKRPFKVYSDNPRFSMCPGLLQFHCLSDRIHMFSHDLYRCRVDRRDDSGNTEGAVCSCNCKDLFLVGRPCVVPAEAVCMHID